MPPPRSNLRRVWDFVRPYRGRYLAGLACLLVCDILQLVIPRISKDILESLERGAASAATLARSGWTIVAVALVVMGFRFLWRRAILGGSRLVERDLRHAYVSHLMRLHGAWYDHARVGDLMARATDDVGAVQTLVGLGVMASFDGFVLCVTSLSFMVWLSPSLTLVALIPLPLLTVVVGWLGQRVHDRATEVQNAFSTISENLQETFAGIRVLKDYAQEPHQLDHVGRICREYYEKSMRLAVVSGLMHPAVTLLIELSFAASLLVGGRAVIRGEMTLGALVAFLAYLDILVWPMIAIGWVMNLVQRGTASMGRLASVLDTVPAIADPVVVAGGETGTGQGTPPDAAPGELEFRDLSFAYDGAVGEALRHVSFTVPRGASLGIVGLTGSGKSTLVRLLLRQYEPPPGTVFVGGRDVRDYRLAELRSRFAVVPQDTFLFSGPLRRNLLFGGEGDEEAQRRALAAAGLLEEAEALPDGLDTVVGERGVTLSGGQAQRLAIARALILDRPVLVLDDCLSAVDAATERRVLGSLRGEVARRTAVIVSNRVAAVAGCDEILVLRDGHVEARGRHGDLSSGDGIYASMARRQQLEAWIETH